ncbi:MAG: DNA repair protein RadA [Candidatus Omnitrophota bacterium]
MKLKTIFTCQSCGYQAPKWLGRCPDCSGWNCFVEEDYRGSGPVAGERLLAQGVSVASAEPVLLESVEAIKDKRILTNIGELDRVLGGGIVPGSVTLVAGDPGIGKSTLSLQVVSGLARAGHSVLYISGEESLQQVKLRASRLTDKEAPRFYLVNHTDLGAMVAAIDKLSPAFVIVDSIQVISSNDLSSGPGSVSQVRHCAATLTALAKSRGLAMFIIGHVTKEGTIAGPRVLEHIVDTVLYFEGEKYSLYRILRAVKNRFGSTNEIGVFEMNGAGLQEVANPSQIFLSQRPEAAPGSVVVAAIEGSRPILTEVQALVSRSNFGFAQRRAQGVDNNKLSLLAAVLEKRMGLNLANEDIFVNVAGGIKVDDPACDLGMAVAVASGLSNRPVCADTVVLGEVGLTGEVRSISYAAMRVSEAGKLGFKRCIFPVTNFKDGVLPGVDTKKIECLGVRAVKEALELVY